MKQQLFPTAPIKKSTNNVTVGEHYSPQHAYIDGYYEAAKILVDSALKKQRREKEVLFYPICFNYRHYVELHLKSLIESAEELYFKMEILGYAKGILKKSPEDALNKIHSIEKLFCYFEKRLKLVTVKNEIFDPNIQKYIMEFHTIDSNGQKFRYHITKKQQPSFPIAETFNLKNIGELMEKINGFLYAVDAWLDHHIEISNEMAGERNNT